MKILWTSGASQRYYSSVSGYTLESWKYLIGDKILYLDEPFKIPTIETRNTLFSKWRLPPQDFNTTEKKFWRKSRSIVSALNDAIKENYDYVIWLDGDVEVIKQPDLDAILPNGDEVVSAVQNKQKFGTGLDTGFVAFNLNSKQFNNLLFEYTYFWQTPKIHDLPYRFDAPVLEKILEKHIWKNLYVDRDVKGKSHCGFENSLLDSYFIHYWGKKQKMQQFS
jgi:hypothetical protein